MRHGKRRTRLNRTTALRLATLSMIAKSLFIHQSIKTTLPKAKEARRVAERLITIAKRNDLASRRQANSVLKDRSVTTKLFKEIAPLFTNRIGGYTRIIPLRFRRGDGANIVILELTEKIKEEPKKVKSQKSKVSALSGSAKGGKSEEIEKTKKEKAVKIEKEKPQEPHKAVPQIKPEEKDEKIVEEVRKEKARKEEKKIEKKSFFKKFFRRRTSM